MPYERKATNIAPGDEVCLRLQPGIRPRSTKRHPWPLPEQPIIVEDLITYPTSWSIRQREPHLQSYVGSPGAICCWQDSGKWRKREFPIEMLRLVKSNPNPAVEFVSPRLQALFSRIRAGTGTISQMNDREVRQCGLHAMDTADPRKNFNPGFKTQLLAARAEWLRRYGGRGPDPFHKMNPVGSTVIARLKCGALDREVIAEITAIDKAGKMHISFGGITVQIEPAQIIYQTGVLRVGTSGTNPAAPRSANKSDS